MSQSRVQLVSRLSPVLGLAIIRAILPVAGALWMEGCRKPPANLQPFSSVFEKTGEVVLRGLANNAAGSSAPSSHGTIYVADRLQGNVREYDLSGSLMRTIGVRGWGAGQFSNPWALTTDTHGNLYVLDVDQSRVNIFSDDGVFRSSFVLTPYGVFGISLAVDSQGSIYVGAWSNTKRQQAPAIYKFDRDGTLIHSQYSRNPLVSSLNLAVVGGVAMALDSSDNLYASQPVSPQITRYSSDGLQSSEFGHAPSGYNPPFKFPKDPSTQKLDSLLKKWSEFYDLLVLPDGTTIAAFSIHSPKEYSIEIFDPSGRLITCCVGTDMQPAFRDSSGQIFFRVDPYNRLATGDTTIMRFSLRGANQQQSSAGR